MRLCRYFHNKQTHVGLFERQDHSPARGGCEGLWRRDPRQAKAAGWRRSAAAVAAGWRSLRRGQENRRVGEPQRRDDRGPTRGNRRSRVARADRAAEQALAPGRQLQRAHHRRGRHGDRAGRDISLCLHEAAEHHADRPAASRWSFPRSRPTTSTGNWNCASSSAARPGTSPKPRPWNTSPATRSSTTSPTASSARTRAARSGRTTSASTGSTASGTTPSAPAARASRRPTRFPIRRS